MQLRPELVRARLALLPPRPEQRDASEPEWWVRLSALWLARRSPDPLLRGTEHEELLGVIDPLLHRAYRELKRTLAQHAEHLGDVDAIAKASILTAMPRLASLCRELRPRAKEELFEEYPVLGFQLIERLDQWTDAAVEAVERTIASLPELSQVFGVSKARIEELELGFGAPHGNGRTVARVLFSDGTTLALKPRSVAAEAELQQAVAWLEERTSVPLRRLRVLDRGTHGFVEWVEHDPLPSPDFHRRRGALLALSHALLLTGLEKNIVGAGEHPILVDAETVDPSRDPIQAVEQADPDLSAGFDDAYRIIAADPQRFIAEVVDRFSRTPRRITVRPTETYAELLCSSQQPELLRSAAAREIHFNRLWRSTNEKPELFTFVHAEIAALLRGDVPRFESRSGVISEPASGPIEVRAEDDLTLSRARVRRLGDADLRRQQRLTQAVSDPSSTTLFDASYRLGTWLAIRLDSAISADALSSNLYDGYPGLALLFAQLAKRSGERYFEDAASTLIRCTESAVHRRDISPLGGFRGWSGLIYALAYFDALEASAHRLPLVKLAAERALTSVPPDSLDILAGAAGTLAILVRAHSLYRDPLLLELARSLGDRLLDQARDTFDGVRWATHDVLGFGAGSCGIAWALDLLARSTGDARHRHASELGLRFVRSVFDPARAELTWCEGAPGIAVTLLEDGDDRLLEIARASSLTPGRDDSLCHGTMGNLEIAQRIAIACDDLELREQIDRSALALARTADRSALGLMNGLGGVAYGLLRLADRHVPSLLGLELPRITDLESRSPPPPSHWRATPAGRIARNPAHGL